MVDDYISNKVGHKIKEKIDIKTFDASKILIDTNECCELL